MDLWQRFVGNVRNEVKHERLGWLTGGFVKRQFLALSTLLPALAAMALLRDSEPKSVVVWGSFGIWVVWNVLTLSVGMFYIARWADNTRR